MIIDIKPEYLLALYSNVIHDASIMEYEIFTLKSPSENISNYEKLGNIEQDLRKLILKCLPNQ